MFTSGRTLCLLALVLAAWRPAHSQMESPLKGRGLPRPETTKVFVSVYLDRLLEVNEDLYRWEAVHFFYLSWTDNSAAQTIQANTQQALTNSSYTCQFYCSNVENSMCCDGIFLPSFLFKNAYGFSQDREIMRNIYVSSDGTSVMWENRVHGTYYQPMDFSHYPFDSFDLSIELRFYDPTTNWAFTGNHSGITVLPSSGGLKLFTIGRGDDASSWAVTDMSLQTYSVDLGAWFSNNSYLTSDPSDPTPLNPANASFSGGYTYDDGTPVNAFTGVTDQLLGYYITVERYWKPSLINAVLPVLLVFLLAMMVFFTSESALDTRLEIVVTLFLALTAVQFVVVGQLPTSSYIVPSQQLVLATYILLFLLAVESIAVYHIVCRHEKAQEAQRRREAYRRYCKLRNQGKLQGGQNPPLSAAASQALELGDEAAAVECGEVGCQAADVDAVKAADSQPAALGRSVTFASCSASEQDGGAADGLGAATPPSQPRVRQLRKPFSVFFHTPKAMPPRRSLSAFSQMTADEAYGWWLGHWVDQVCAALLAVGYGITAVLIFTLQHGFIELFPDS